MKKPNQKNKLAKSIIMVLFFILVGNFKATATIELGYRAGLFLNAGQLNSIIHEYNAQNPWQKFKPVHFGLGGRMIFGAHAEYITYFAGLKWLRSTQISSGIDPATSANNSKRLVVHYGGIIFGMHTNGEGPLSVGFEFNAFNYYVLRIQESTSTEVKSAASTEIVNNYNPDISIFARYAVRRGVTGISLIPALDLPLFHGRNDITDLRQQWKLYAPGGTHIMRGYNISLTLSVLLGKKRY